MIIVKKILNYIKLLNLIIRIYPGSYQIKFLEDEKKYWNNILKFFIKNKITYINEHKILNLPKGILIISNHINVTDVLLIRNKINCFVIGKSNLSDDFKLIKVFEKEFFTNLSTIPYERNNIEDGKKVKENILAKIKNKQNVLVFPEGTTQINSDSRILPFKKGLFYLAYEHNIPILPIVLYYEDDNYGLDKNKDFDIFYLLNNISKVYVHFNSLVIPNKFSNVEHLIYNIYEKMNKIKDNYSKKLEKNKK